MVFSASEASFARPCWQLLGAAVAALAAQTFWSAAMWLTARRIAGVDVSILPKLREVSGRTARIGS